MIKMGLFPCFYLLPCAESPNKISPKPYHILKTNNYKDLKKVHFFKNKIYFYNIRSYIHLKEFHIIPYIIQNMYFKIPFKNVFTKVFVNLEQNFGRKYNAK